MSYVIPAYSYTDEADSPSVQAVPELRFVPRSRKQWIPFLFPLLVCGASWMGGGVPVITDLGFSMFTALLAGFLIMEFYRFPVRFGIGGLVLYGGSLCWFCHDYFTNWFGHNFNDEAHFIAPEIIAKVATLHVLFIMMLSIGLGIRWGRFMERVILFVPEPEGEGFYLLLVLTLFAIGLSPYFIFNAEPWYMAIYHSLFAGWGVGLAQFTVSRTGSVNYNWGGYVAQIIQVGQVGGILAVMYAMMITRRFVGRLLGFSIWAFWAMVAVSDDRRGEVAFFLLPPIALLFIKYQSKAAVAFKRFSLRAYVICGILAIGLFWVVQFQGTFRGTGFGGADLSKVDITRNQGNTMFSEGLLAYSIVPSQYPFFRDSFPGEAIIRPIPQTIYELIIGIIPRALWHDKPIDPLWEWYNAIYNGTANGRVGTTISHGLVGSWYFNYGIFGILEGGLLVGWCFGVAERALQQSNGQPIGVMMSLAFATWLFRTFRDWIFIDLYGLIIGAIGLWVLIKLLSPFFGTVPRQGQVHVQTIES